MKSCFTTETQETNVSLKSQASNRETYVQMVAEKQVQDQLKADNEKATAGANSVKEVFFSKNVSEQIELVSKSCDETNLDNVKNEVNVSCKSKLDAEGTWTSDSSNEETCFFPQPEWFANLDEVSRGRVRDLCGQAGPPPVDQEYIGKLRALFDIDLGQALEVNEIYHSGRLQRASQVKLKSILKTSSQQSEAGSIPTITRRLSWVDEKGGNLVQKHELKTWHYMDSKRSSTTQCCQIL